MLCFFSFCPQLVTGQNLFPDRGVVFDDTSLPTVNIEINQEYLDLILDNQNLQSNEEYPAIFLWTQNGTTDTLLNIGFRLRGNTSRHSAKKSFKIDFTKFGEKRFHGLREMNLNGEHNDPGIIRAKLAFDMYKLAGIPSSRVNAVLLYINKEYKGIYLNVEHIDESYLNERYVNKSGNLYKCYYGSDFRYLGRNSDDYKLAPYGNRIYELKTNEEEDDYSDLAEFIKILNSTNFPDYECQLENNLNVDLFLRAMAMDILSGNWDGPLFNKNNSYWYYNPAESRFEYIPFDLDNTFGVDWFGINWATRSVYHWGPNELRPLYKNILAIEEYRNKFSYYLDKFIGEFFNKEWVEQYTLDHLDLIKDHRKTDIYAEADYGYTYDDFLASYTEPLGGHIKSGLIPYVEERKNSTLAELKTNVIHPIIKAKRLDWDDESIIFEIDTEKETIESLTVNYQFENQTEWTSKAANDSGSAYDNKTNDGIFTVGIPLQGIGKIKYFFLAENGAINSQWPRCGSFQDNVGYNAVPPLYINEMVVSNSTFPDEYGDTDDWIEIYNAGDQEVFLGDKYLSDNHNIRNKWPFPTITIAPKEYIIIWADDESHQGDLHTNFRLSREGETIGIWDSEENNFAPIDTFTYGPLSRDISLGRYPDGIGEMKELSSVTPGFPNAPYLFPENPELNFRIFPNPSLSLIHIEADAPIQKVEIRNINGLFMESYPNINFSTYQINLNNWPKGVYIISIFTEFAIESRKIIKM